MGGGYGINRSVSGGSALTTAEPAMKGCARHPGSVSASATGKTGKSHFAGAKIYRNK